MGMDNVLMVAEKPSIADSIAYALCHTKSKARSGKTPVHEFESVFQGKPARFKVRFCPISFFPIQVTSVTGHIYSCDFPSEYSNWDAVDPLHLFSARTIKKVEGSGIIK